MAVTGFTASTGPSRVLTVLKGGSVKKLIVLLILVALGVIVARAISGRENY